MPVSPTNCGARIGLYWPSRDAFERVWNCIPHFVHSCSITQRLDFAESSHPRNMTTWCPAALSASPGTSSSYDPSFGYLLLAPKLEVVSPGVGRLQLIETKPEQSVR
jgi:hypothetical protein